MLLVFFFGHDGFCWKPTNNPEQVSLWEGGRQIGVVEIQSGKFLALEKGRFVPGDCPVEIPTEYGGKPKKESETDSKKHDPTGPGLSGFSAIPTQENVLDGSQVAVAGKPGARVNFGLDRSEFPAVDGEFFAYNGEPIERAAAEKLLYGGKVRPDTFVDDSAALRLTLVGPQAQTRAALDLLAKADDWGEISRGVLVADYLPGDFALAGKGYEAPSKGVGFFLTDATGKLLFEGTEAGGVLDALRRVKKPIGIDWFSWWVGFSPLTWMFGVGASSFHLPVEFVLLVIGAVVVSILVLRRGASAPAGGGAK